MTRRTFFSAFAGMVATVMAGPVPLLPKLQWYGRYLGYVVCTRPRVIHQTYALGFKVTPEMIEDDLLNTARKWQDAAAPRMADWRL